MRVIILIALLAFSYCSETFAEQTTKGTRFWVGFMENLPHGLNASPNPWGSGAKGVGEYYIEIYTDKVVEVTFWAPNYPYRITKTFYPNQRNVFKLAEAFEWVQEGSDIIHQGGLMVEANHEIELIAWHARIYFSESTMVLPETLLGTTYTVLAKTDDLSPQNRASGSTTIVLATENNTWVQIISSINLSHGQAKGVPYRVKLNKGEIYQLTEDQDLSGTKITGMDGKKIAVFSGSKSAHVRPQECSYDGNSEMDGDNHLYEQQLPDIYCGKRYMLNPFTQDSRHDNGTHVKVVSLGDNNHIVVKNLIDTVLSKSAVMEFDIQVSQMLKATEKCMVATFTSSDRCSGLGDPSMTILKPTDYTQQLFTFCDPGTMIAFQTMTDNYIQLYFPDGRPETLLVNLVEPTDIKGVTKKELFDTPDGYAVELKFFNNYVSTNKCYEIVTNKPAQALWYMYTDKHDATSTFLGFSIPDSVEKEERIIHSKLEVILYPNPIVQSDAHIKVLTDAQIPYPVVYQMYNEIGQLCATRSLVLDPDLSNSFTIPMAGFAPGVYELKLSIGGAPIHKRILKLD